MLKESAPSERETPKSGSRFVLRLPGLITDDAIGAGDIIKRVTSTIGIQPCSGCQRRARALNRLMSVQGQNRT